MADIKTRDAVKGTIKTIDKAAVASERMKSAYSKIKDKAEQGYYAEEGSATEYAADKVSAASERITNEGVHQFNKQGQKAVKTTKDNIVKAKDKLSDFKQKRAAKAAEKRMSGNSVQTYRSTVSHSADKAVKGANQAEKTIQLLTDSISYFIGKKCHLPDEEIQLSDGMATVSHFNTLPLVAHLGTAVTALSKGILLEVERNIKIINRERMAQHEQTEYQSEIQGAGRDDASRSANLQQQRSRSTPGQVRPDGPGIPQRESPGAIYDFENGWQSDGDHAPGTGRGDREDRSPDAAKPALPCSMTPTRPTSKNSRKRLWQRPIS